MTKHALFLGALLLTFVSVLTYAQAPVPFVNQPLVPDATAPGGPQFTLTVNGTGFVSNSVVNWNGNALQTQFVSDSQLTATVPATDIATANTASVTVVNPAPGGGTSNVVFFSVTANTGDSVAFAVASSPAVGAGPHSVAVGDFNGDGKLDLATDDVYSNTISILLGNGRGNFTLASSLAVGTYPSSVAVGDFNGDGKLDLAVTNSQSNDLSILLGDGTGNFILASSASVGSNPQYVAVGDFNRDGKLDLAVASGFTNAVYILLGDGTGNFTLASSIDVGNNPTSVAVGDFNGDGKLDLAVTNSQSNDLSILLGDGAGDFTLASSLAVGSSPLFVAVGDFNGDGKLDLAVANFYDNNVSILLGDGTGNFTLASSLDVGNNPDTVALGDFNGDGKLDLAVSNFYDGTVSILLGDGTGNFALASSLGVGSWPEGSGVGDFNGDGKLDLAVADNASNNVSILLGGPLAGSYLRYDPDRLTFGTQLIGTNSGPQQVTLTNVGSMPLDITKAGISSNFSQTNNCPHELAPGGQCTANVVFTPHNVNTINGTMSIYDNAPNSPQTIPLSGVGTAVTLLPSNLDFGDQQVGTTSQPQAVTLTNYAPKAVTISGADLTGNNPGSFVVQGSTCGRSLPAGQSCTANIAFRPRATGPKNATFNVNDNGGVSPQTVALSGTGTK